MAKLTPAQTKIMKEAYEGDIRWRNHHLNMNTVDALRSRGLIESYITGSIDADEYHRRLCTGGAEPIPSDTVWFLRLTDSGLQLARQLFGSPEPEPTPDASEPDDVLIDEPVPYKPLASFKVKARIGEVRDYTGTQDTASAYPAPLTAAEKREIVASEKPVIEWHDLNGLPMHHFKNALQRVGFITWRDRLPLCDINGNAIRTSQDARRRDLQPTMAKHPRNVQKRLKSKPTRKIKPIQKLMQTVTEVLENAA